CGLLAATLDEDPDSIIARHALQWDSWIAQGHLGLALRDIDELPESLNIGKPFLRIQLLYRAGFTSRALEAIEQEYPLGEDADPAAVVNLAHIAQEAGGSTLAAKLLDQAISSLASYENLGLALRTAEAIDNPALEERVAQRLGTLFPDSPDL